jgi:tungstate transport system substrate-binding protein
MYLRRPSEKSNKRPSSTGSKLLLESGLARNRRVFCGLVGALLALVACQATRAHDAPPIRCAVVGGLVETDFWPDLADRFERETGRKVELAATGPKQVLVAAFRERQADLILMHAGDAAINLVADGFGVDPQPWLRSDMVLVGPASDPAGIKGEKDAAVALRKIIHSKSQILIHASQGAGEVLHELLAAEQLELDPECTVSLPSDKHRQMLLRAAKEQAYTLVGRIPFLNGKVDTGGLAIMVQGDPRLRRAYLVVVAAPDKNVRYEGARALAAWLREPQTQRFVAEYGRGKYDDQPLFFPVVTKVQ